MNQVGNMKDDRDSDFEEALEHPSIDSTSMQLVNYNSAKDDMADKNEDQNVKFAFQKTSIPSMKKTVFCCLGKRFSSIVIFVPKIFEVC
jgi:hypothetical protein